MIKRIHIYLKEMYPPFPRVILAICLFFTAYFVILANNNISSVNIGIQELVAILTIFSFLLALRIADEFKDLDTDKINFPKRPLPSGRVTKTDLVTLLLFFQIPTILLNIVFMNNIQFLLMLYIYGISMYFWFFAKKIIKPNLFLALITHNPVQLFLMLYITSFICFKYQLELFSPIIFIVIICLYLPGLIWEIGRKIRSPKSETKYTTYSKIWGFHKSILYLSLLMIVNTVFSCLAIGQFSLFGIIALIISASVVMLMLSIFRRKPTKKGAIGATTAFIYSQELIILFTSIVNVYWNIS